MRGHQLATILGMRNACPVRPACPSGSNHGPNPNFATRRGRITSDWELQLAIVEWSEREQAREADVLHAWSLRITRRLASPDTRTWGMCALWELSCRPENHHSIGEDLIHTMLLAMEAGPAGGAPEIEQDGAATGSKCDENLRTVAMAAATCWMLGQVRRGVSNWRENQARSELGPHQKRDAVAAALGSSALSCKGSAPRPNRPSRRGYAPLLLPNRLILLQLTPTPYASL